MIAAIPPPASQFKALSEKSISPRSIKHTLLAASVQIFSPLPQATTTPVASPAGLKLKAEVS